MAKIFKYILMTLVLCLLPVWAFLPVVLAGMLAELFGPFIAVVVCVPFTVWFYQEVF